MRTAALASSSIISLASNEDVTSMDALALSNCFSCSKFPKIIRPTIRGITYIEERKVMKYKLSIPNAINAVPLPMVNMDHKNRHDIKRFWVLNSCWKVGFMLPLIIFRHSRYDNIKTASIRADELGSCVKIGSLVRDM